MALSIVSTKATSQYAFTATLSGLEIGHLYHIDVTDGLTGSKRVQACSDKTVTSSTQSFSCSSSYKVKDVEYFFVVRDNNYNTSIGGIKMEYIPAPTTPSSITYASSINSYYTTKISWGNSTVEGGGSITYILERSTNGGGYSQVYSGTGTSYRDGLSSGTTSVVYRVKAMKNNESSGYRTGTSSSVYYNVAPGIPASISVPSSVKVGKTLTVNWGTASDTNLSGYILERSGNGGTYTQVYKGANRSFTDTAVNGWNTILYRVKAYDAYNEMSGYKTSSAVTVTYNTEPAISGNNADLGIKNGSFSVVYTITDPDAGQTLTTVEKIDGIQKRSYTAVSGTENTFSVTAEEWLKLSNTSHTLTITVNDGQGGTATREYTFTKKETEIEMTLKTPVKSDKIITRVVLNVERVVPEDAVFKVEACNNGFDAVPVWENVTIAVLEKRKYFFSNKTKLATDWGFNFRVTVQRKNSIGACYIYGIAGNMD